MFLHVPLPAVVLRLVASGSSTAPARAAAAAQPEAPESKQGGDLPGWKQVFEEEFSAGDAVWVASLVTPTRIVGARAIGMERQTPRGKKSGGKSGYYPSKVLSVHDGVLDWYRHSDNGYPWVQRRSRRSPTRVQDR
ncbi:MAG: glycoside hydrolase family 16, partial [Arthrobacter sp.]|nr:glycoside hydrolase family 16 [Arthrobacter sp.]